MSFVDAVRSVLSKYSDFSGRARRSEYWWFALFMFLVLIVPYGMMLAGDSVRGIGTALFGLVLLVFLVPNIAVTVRRLHDTGRSGWWYLLSFVPGGGIVLLVFALLDSEPMENAYGPSPKPLPAVDGDVAAAPAV